MYIGTEKAQLSQNKSPEVDICIYQPLIYEKAFQSGREKKFFSINRAGTTSQP